MTDPDEPIAILRVSRARRVFSVAVQVALGLLLIWVALTLPERQLLIQALLAILGAGALWQAAAVWRATGTDVVLTRGGLRDSAGRTIADLDRIEAVQRGAFAFKPSNGFSLKLTEPAPRAWVPGVWWRLGTRVGVGGATSGKAARQMADVIALMKAGHFPD
ncbi:hypothetical protein GE300_08955 [Rhodobacteraceae bacterium 2CG4]|uniref:PH (Pleckstrin Homology) domain-containing protein n=1 Tax=Halovulum marinum TaxID=2662447 RepID=A0A6L5YZK5_9RHOB|nr:hypothetical protein [Halovulum marinum]MSU89746.1 hypothetical protein [Halovulum marinum]